MYKLVYWVVKAISLLPFCCLYLLSDFLYYIVYYVVKYRRKVVRENLTLSFPKKTEKEIIKIEKQFYRHFSDLLMETVKLLSMSEKQINQRMKYINSEKLIRHYQENRSVIVLTSHYCNWEWHSTFSRMLPKDKPLHLIYKKLSSKTTNKLMLKIRGKNGGKNVEMRQIVRHLITMSKEGKVGMFGMISDQSPARRNNHLTTQFLSQKTMVITGSEQLSKKFNIPVYYIKTKKVKRGFYVSEPIELSLNPQEVEDFQISEKYIKLFEKDILEAPEYWLWTHNRWKHTRNK